MARFDSNEHIRWLSYRMHQVLEYGHKAFLPGGYGYINADGSVDESKPVEMDLTARSTYIYALGVSLGIPGSLRRCEHGIRALTHAFKDSEFGGWFTFINPLSEREMLSNVPGTPAGKSGQRKSSRPMSYLLEASAAATIAKVPGAKELLDEAIEIEEKYFWDESVGRVNDNFERDFSAMEPYHGMSSNLHAVSAFLTIADATGEDKWIERAQRIVSFAIEEASKNNWRVPEHYDINWQIDKEYNVGTPADPRRPYGINIGHCFAWSRRVVQVSAALAHLGKSLPKGFIEAAFQIFDRAAADSWRKEGRSGFLFTVDYEGKPLMRQHFSWVASEALQAATALGFTLAERSADDAEIDRYLDLYNRWWDFLEGYVIQPDGYWVGELNPNNKPDDTVWPGAPDIYHSVRVLLAPRLPNTPSKPAAIAAGMLDHPVAHEFHDAIWV